MLLYPFAFGASSLLPDQVHCSPSPWCARVCALTYEQFGHLNRAVAAALCSPAGFPKRENHRRLSLSADKCRPLVRGTRYRAALTSTDRVGWRSQPERARLKGLAAMLLLQRGNEIEKLLNKPRSVLT